MEIVRYNPLKLEKPKYKLKEKYLPLFEMEIEDKKEPKEDENEIEEKIEQYASVKFLKDMDLEGQTESGKEIKKQVKKGQIEHNVDVMYQSKERNVYPIMLKNGEYFEVPKDLIELIKNEAMTPPPAPKLDYKKGAHYSQILSDPNVVDPKDAEEAIKNKTIPTLKKGYAIDAQGLVHKIQ